jgi:hypothetical protein
MCWKRTPTPDGLDLANCRALIAAQEDYYKLTNQGQNP